MTAHPMTPPTPLLPARGESVLRILAIDSASLTGWSTNALGGVESGTKSFELRRGDSSGMRFLEFRRWLAQMLDTLQPEAVFYEQPASHMPSGLVAEILYGFTTRIVEICEERGVACRAYAPKGLKLWATGNGNARKPAMREAAAALYPHYAAKVTADAKYDEGADEADSLLLLAWGLAGFPEREAKPKRARRKGVVVAVLETRGVA